MFEIARWSSQPAVRVGVVSTFPPTRCGIGRFTCSLMDGLNAVDPGVEVSAIRLVGPDDHDVGSGAKVAMEVDPSSPVAIRAAASHLNRGDSAIISHEFGIFGPDDGVAAVELARLLTVPTITILHTVVPDPTPRQREILAELAQLTTPVVICAAAATFLADRYGVDPAIIQVVPHGAQWGAQSVNPPPRRELITWGLLGPGKGLERAITAISHLKLDPSIRYRIVGRTHPNVVRNAGFVYRDTLRNLVDQLGVGDRVEFVDRYVDDHELMAMVRRSDLVLVPYDNHEQVSSGVITEAIGMGRPVIATRFPFAEEMLASGGGRVVDHDARALARAVEEMLEDPVTYRRAAKAARLKSTELSWPAVAMQYSNLIRTAVPITASA